MKRPTITPLGTLALLLLTLNTTPAIAGTILWSNTGSSAAWLTGGNWTGNAVPTGTDVAQFGANPTASGGVGIKFDNPTTPGPLNQAVGAIEQTSARTSGALVIGNSTTTAGKDGTLTLNGATVNSVANVVVRSASSRDVTIQDTQNTGNKTMALGLANTTENIILLDGAGNIVISSLINSTNGVTPLTISGAGAGRVDITSAANSFGGPIKVTGAEVRFTAAGSLGNSTNTITVDGGRFGIVSGGTVDLSARLIFLGATAGTSVSVPGVTGILTYNGVLADKPSTTGILVKQGGGILSLGGVSTYSGDTSINNGTVKLTTGNNRLPTGTTVALGQSASANLGTLDLNALSQTIAGLNSVTGTSTGPAKNIVTNSAVGAATLTLAGSGTYAFGDAATIANSGVIGGPVNVVKSGSGTQTFGDVNTYTGNTTISGGTLALSGSGSIANSPTIEIGGSGTLDVSSLTTALTLASGQGIKASGTASSGTIATAATKGLTTAASSPLQFTAFNGATPPLTLSGAGTLTLQTANPVTVTISNSGTALSPGDYKLIAKGASGTVSGTPVSVTVNGDGVSGIASLTISNAELYLHVVAPSFSTQSDIVRATGFTEPANIDYASYQATDITAGNSIEVARFTIRDGGGSADSDTAATTLSAISFTVTNGGSLRRVALYDGATEISEIAGGTTLSFTGLAGLAAADGGTKDFSLRATFNAAVTDNQQLRFAISTATANSGGSTFAASDAGGAASDASGDANRIEVTATKLGFLSVPSSVNVNQSFSATVQALDANNNLDLDATTSVTITRATGSGNLGGGGALSLTNGTRTWTALQIDTAGAFTIQAAGGSLTAATSGSITAIGHPLAISGYMANPAGTDSPYEYVQLKALEAIDFSVTPVSVVWANNGTATTNGWIEGGGITYKFNITAGNLAVGDVAYVGGSGKLINGSGTADISGQTWLRAIDAGTSGGDGFGTANSAGVMGNGGANADGIAVFAGTSLTDTSTPIDAVFFGAATGGAVVSSGADGYELPVNDLYSGGFLQSGSTIFFDPAGGAYTKLSGTYNTTSSQWIVPRTATSVTNPAAIGDIASGITIVALAPEPTTQAAGVSFSSVGTNSMTVSWTGGNGTNRIVVVRAGSATSFTPSDASGVSGTVSADFSAASDQGSGNKVCYNGAGSSFTLTGLAPSTTYFVTIYEYNGTGSSANYLTSGTPGSGSQATTCAAAADGFSYLSTKGLSFKIAETNILAHASGSGGVTLASVASASANGINLSRSNGYVLYNGTLTNDDSFGYTVNSVAGGCTATGTVSVAAIAVTGPGQIAIPTNGVATIKFLGIPNYAYVVQTTTNVAGPWWSLSTNTAGNDGAWIFTDLNATNAQQYYRSSTP